MCDGVTEEETKTLQVVHRWRGTGDNFLLDCHCVDIAVHKYDIVLLFVNLADKITVA